MALSSSIGRAWTKRYFNQHWNAAAKTAGITDLHFHDLRGTAVTMLAEAGCTVPEIAAVTGHSLKHVTHILEVYLSRTRHTWRILLSSSSNVVQSVCKTNGKPLMFD